MSDDHIEHFEAAMGKLAANELPTDRQMDAAISAINNYGFDFRAPWECDLDDREREQFEGLKAAVRAALTLAPRPRE